MKLVPALLVAVVFASAFPSAVSARTAPVLPIREARGAAAEESFAFLLKQPWGDSFRVTGCDRGASASRVFCRSKVRGRDPYDLDKLHVCLLTIKARLVKDRPPPRRDVVASRIIARRCSIAVATA